MKIGIVGSGSIVPDFLNACTLIPQIEVTSILGTERSVNRMESLATQYGIDSIYTQYEDFLKSDRVEVVYIALPNHLHFTFAKEALLSGKHVIVEKPFTTSYKEAQELYVLATQRQLFLFEAISNQYFPNYHKVKELLPQLGTLKIVQLNYSQYSRRYDSFKAGNILPAFDPTMAGGALMDLNVYNIHFVVGLFGPPEKVYYYPNIEKDVDTSGILILEYASFQCVAIGAKDCKSPVSINIQGDDGYIHSDKPANVFSDFIFQKNTADPLHFCLNTSSERLYDELYAFTHMMLEQNYEKANYHLQHTLCVMKVLDQARSFLP